MNPQDYAHIIKNGIAGSTASLTGVAVSLVEGLEQWLRIGGLAVGLAIGIVSLYNLIKGREKP